MRRRRGGGAGAGGTGAPGVMVLIFVSIVHRAQRRVRAPICARESEIACSVRRSLHRLQSSSRLLQLRGRAHRRRPACARAGSTGELRSAERVRCAPAVVSAAARGLFWPSQAAGGGRVGAVEGVYRRRLGTRRSVTRAATSAVRKSRRVSLARRSAQPRARSCALQGFAGLKARQHVGRVWRLASGLSTGRMEEARGDLSPCRRRRCSAISFRVGIPSPLSPLQLRFCAELTHPHSLPASFPPRS